MYLNVVKLQIVLQIISPVEVALKLFSAVWGGKI